MDKDKRDAAFGLTLGTKILEKELTKRVPLQKYYLSKKYKIIAFLFIKRIIPDFLQKVNIPKSARSAIFNGFNKIYKGIDEKRFDKFSTIVNKLLTLDRQNLKPAKTYGQMMETARIQKPKVSGLQKYLAAFQAADVIDGKNPKYQGTDSDSAEHDMDLQLRDFTEGGKGKKKLSDIVTQCEAREDDSKQIKSLLQGALYKGAISEKKRKEKKVLEEKVAEELKLSLAIKILENHKFEHISTIKTLKQALTALRH